MKRIEIVGLGFGDEKSLTLGTKECLTSNRPIWLRTEKHPVVPWLNEQGIVMQSFDSVYTEKDDFASVYQEIADRLMESAEQSSDIVYAVPGHPMVAEQTVQILLREAPKRGIEVNLGGGGSFLDIAFSRLRIDPIEGFLLLNGNDLKPAQIHPQMHILIGQVYDRMVASDVKLSLMEIYPDDYPVQLVTALGIESMERIEQIPLLALDRQDSFTDLTSVYLPPVKKEETLYRRFDFLTDTIAHLRGPEGCPWDREQTHESLRPYLLEEAYEFLDAVHKQDDEAMEEELGDVLLQVILHAQIARDAGSFDIHDVIETLTAKMIRRHPHVFADREADTADQVVKNWEEIKREEKKEPEHPSVLDGIPDQLSLLLKAYEIQKKAAKVGFDWERDEEVFDKVVEELEELRQAQTDEEREEELGDLLFALGSVARFYHVNPEIALFRTYQKFQKRFRYIEEKARQLKKPLSALSLEQLEQWWIEAKG